MIECIFIGDELLDGRILNRNQQSIAGFLAVQGYLVKQATSITDHPDQIQTVIKDAMKRSRIIITTGGLGPTEDDRTTKTIADTLNLSLFKDDDSIQKIKDYFNKTNRPFYESNEKQGLFPNGAIVIPNNNGTAPGFALKHKNTWLFVLPGPPSEMLPMLNGPVLDLLNKHCSAYQKHLKTSLFKCYGAAESELSDRLSTLYPLPKG